MNGKPPSRDVFDETSPPHRGSSVPATGKKDHGKEEAEGGFEPQPQ
jgi:hypothetical protein